jgi:uncharacterized protein (DUF1499 family)
MSTCLKWLGIGAAVVAVLLWISGQLGLLAGTPPSDLGVRDGKLARPSAKPNSVSSQARLWPDHRQGEYADIAPLALLRGNGPATIATLKTLLATEPGATLINSRADYLYVQYTTRLLNFVDDVEFWFDPANKVIQVRSASRIGRSDLGVNRQRIEALRQRLATS